MGHRPIVALSSNVRDFEKLHECAAKLELFGYDALVPIDIFKYVPEINIKKNSHLLESLFNIRCKKIDQSEALFVYFKPNSSIEDYIGTCTLREIKYACENSKTLYVCNLPKNLENASYGKPVYISELGIKCVNCSECTLTYNNITILTFYKVTYETINVRGDGIWL